MKGLSHVRLTGTSKNDLATKGAQFMREQLTRVFLDVPGVTIENNNNNFIYKDKTGTQRFKWMVLTSNSSYVGIQEDRGSSNYNHIMITDLANSYVTDGVYNMDIWYYDSPGMFYVNKATFANDTIPANVTKGFIGASFSEPNGNGVVINGPSMYMYEPTTPYFPTISNYGVPIGSVAVQTLTTGLYKFPLVATFAINGSVTLPGEYQEINIGGVGDFFRIESGYYFKFT